MKKSKLFRWTPITILIVLMISLYTLFGRDYLTFSALSLYHKQLTLWTQAHYIESVSLFMFIYILAVATSIPGSASFLTITAGFLFGVIPGTIAVVISATLGASILFISVKTALRDWFRKRAKGWVKRMEEGFRRNAFSYLVFLRLVPIFPFWAINIAAALLEIEFRAFFLATLFGIIPATLVFASLGNGLESLFEKGKMPDLSLIFEPQILIPILALAILSLLPIAYKKLKARKND